MPKKSSEQKILDFLKKEGEASASRISVSLVINYDRIEPILAEMLDKDKIELVQKSRGNYYKLVEVKK